MMLIETGARIEGFCYCLCGHTAGKHTTPDVKSESFKCREPGCICKKYVHSAGAEPKQRIIKETKAGKCDGCGEDGAMGPCGICGGTIS